jgi:hypothetical protein
MFSCAPFYNYVQMAGKHRDLFAAWYGEDAVCTLLYHTMLSELHCLNYYFAVIICQCTNYAKLLCRTASVFKLFNSANKCYVLHIMLCITLICAV